MLKEMFSRDSKRLSERATRRANIKDKTAKKFYVGRAEPMAVQNTTCTAEDAPIELQMMAKVPEIILDFVGGLVRTTWFHLLTQESRLRPGRQARDRTLREAWVSIMEFVGLDDDSGSMLGTSAVRLEFDVLWHSPINHAVVRHQLKRWGKWPREASPLLPTCAS